MAREAGRKAADPRLGNGAQLGLSVLCALLALLSVAALLAWVFGLGSFAVWFRFVSLPAVAALAGIGLALAKSGRYPRLRLALVAGCVGGLLGTIGYDLFRVPFAVVGMRLFAPVDSYGVLLLDTAFSSPWTSLAGWGYHFSNGICFGVAYAALALGRRWWWGVAWGMVLETATVVTPFSGSYGLRGQWGVIAVAYAAHVAYGAPLGVLTENAERWAEALSRPRLAMWMLVGVAVALVAWVRPFGQEARASVTALVDGPTASIVRGRFVPEWIRVAPGGCATLSNHDGEPYSVRGAVGSPTVPPATSIVACFADEGVHRVRTGSRPYSGGFVIVDGEM